MAPRYSTQSRKSQKRALIVVQVGVCLTVLIGMAALTIDVGQLYSARADLQRAADSAALAGASAYLTDEMMQIRLGTANSDALGYVQTLGTDRAVEFSALNNTLNIPTLAKPEDITLGHLNLYSSSDTVHANPVPKDYNAVQVIVRRVEGGDEGSGGAVPLFFAPIFGQATADVSASAVAVFDDRFSSFAADLPGDAGTLPFTIHEDAFYQELAEGGDSYAYSEETAAVVTAGDGIREIRLYPYPLSGSGYEEGDGNFGMLNIGTGNQGVDAETVQILNGVSADDFVMEIGTSELTFANDAGGEVTYEMTGSPGLEVALKAPISEIIGTVVGFFLHDNVVLSGSNATYTITGIRFGRVMDIRLVGAPNQRGLFLQPVAYVGGGVTIDPQAPSSGGLVGRLVLAR